MPLHSRINVTGTEHAVLLIWYYEIDTKDPVFEETYAHDLISPLFKTMTDALRML